MKRFGQKAPFPHPETWVYLDRNVMSYFCDPSKSAHLSYELFRNLVQSKKLVPLISSALLAETIPVINAKNDVTKIRNLSFLEEFYTPDSWVKEYEDLLRDSIMAFATGRRRPVPLVRFEIRIRELIGREAAVVDELRKDIEDSQLSNVRALREMEQLRSDAYEEFFPDGRTSFKDVEFTDLWSKLSESYASDLAESFGQREQCEKRGLCKLLEVPEVRSQVGVHLSFQYHKFIKTLKLRHSDVTDLIHAVLASAARTFVTDDRDLRTLLNVIPDLPYKVLSPEEFLRRLKGLEASLR